MTPSPEQIRVTLDALIQAQHEDYASLSRMLGRNPTYIQQFIKRGVPRRLREEDRRRLADYLGVSEEVLGADSGRVNRLQRQAPHEAAGSGLSEATSDYVLIPRYDVRASAGDGTHPDNEVAETALAFQTRWARQISSGGIGALSVIRVEGDSMLPSLADGDHILLDTADCTSLRDGIYVLRVDDALHVKRLSVHPATKRLTIASDNPAYPSWSDCDPEQVKIIGRVVWIGRQI